MLTRAFWEDALTRAARTFAQSALATLGTGAIDLLSVNWEGVLSIGGGAAVISILMSLSKVRSKTEGEDDDPPTDRIPKVDNP